MSLPRLLLVLTLVIPFTGCYSLRQHYCQKPPCDPPAVACPSWCGIYPTVVTPWKCGGGVDEAALALQIDYQLRGGVHGLLVLGTIGEGEYATFDERAQVIKTAVKRTGGKTPVVVGIHTSDLDSARKQIAQARELGANAVLVKYLGDPCASGEQVLGFFAALTKEKLPIFYYHYPSQTGLRLSSAEVATILSVPGVVGIKESTLDLDEVAEHIALTRGLDTTFLSGTALNLTQFMELGGHGAMCPEALLLPGHTVSAHNAAVIGDWKTARSLQKDLFVVAPLLKGGLTTERTTRLITMAAQDHTVVLPIGNDHPQARLKAALDGLCIPTYASVKCPLPELTRWDRHKVKSAVRKLAKLECGPPPDSQYIPPTVISPPPPSRCPTFLPPG